MLFDVCSRHRVIQSKIGDDLLSLATQGETQEFANLGIERPARVGHAIDPAVQPIARRVAQVVLHVPDDRVVPVGDIQRAVGADLGVDRPEVLVGGLQDRLRFRPFETGAVFSQLVVAPLSQVVEPVPPFQTSFASTIGGGGGGFMPLPR